MIPSFKMVRQSVEIRDLYRVSFWDANIVAAAEAADCDLVLSEALSTGRYYAGIEVINPLRPSFDIFRILE